MTLDRFKILIKHEQLCLLPFHKISAHLTSENERSCYFLEATSNWDLNTKWLTTRSQKLQNPWDFGRHIKYMSSISAQNFSPIDDDHKDISLSKETDFKTETKTLDAWISLNTSPNDMKFLSHIYSYMIYKITKLQTQKSLNKGDMTKKPDLAQNFEKFLTLTKHILFFWNFESRSVL